MSEGDKVSSMNVNKVSSNISISQITSSDSDLGSDNSSYDSEEKKEKVGELT